MTAPCRVNVSVLSYKRPVFLGETVASIFRQILLPCRVTIFDNGSGEDVYESVRSLVETGLVHWRGADENRGVHWNLQRALTEGVEGSEFLCVMHDDDRYLPDFLFKQTKFLGENPSFAAVACNAGMIDESGRPLQGNMHNPLKRKAVEIFEDVPAVVRLYFRGYLAFPSMVYRSQAAARVTVRPEFGQLTDVVLLTELARQGPLAYINEPLWEYRVHPGQDSYSFNEKDWETLGSYYREIAREFPELKRQTFFYLLKRRLSRIWKRLRGNRK